MATTKENLYEEIQKNIYANNFEDLKVFSKQYFHSVILPCYENNSTKNNYSVISIDFNDMAKINSHGMERGDEILHNSINYMQSVIPEENYCIRMGGDEFLFFLNNTNQEQALQYEQMMHAKLQEHAKDLDDTTVTSYCVNSENTPSLKSMVEIADAGINTIKQTAKADKTKNVSEMDVFKYKVNENFSTFFKNLRLHNFPLNANHIKNVILKSVIAYEHFNQEKTDSEPKQEVNLKEVETFKRNLGDLEQLNKLFISHRDVPPTAEELEAQDTEKLSNLLDSLVHDPLTNQFNKNYLVNYLLENPSKEFKALRLSSSFVKISNTLNSSHSVTDIQIQNSINGLTDFLKQKVEINSEAFTKKDSNHIIALDGGDLIVLLDKEANVSAEEIHKYLEEKNSKEYSNDSILRLVAADDFENMTSENFVKVLAKQSDECNRNKIPLIDKLLDTKLISDLLKITSQDNLNFYKNFVKDSKSFEAKKQYLDIVSKSLMELYQTLDIDHTKKIDQKTLEKETQEQVKIEENKFDGSQVLGQEEYKVGPFRKLFNIFKKIFVKKPKALPAPKEEHTVDEVSNSAKRNNNSQEFLDRITPTAEQLENIQKVVDDAQKTQKATQKIENKEKNCDSAQR